MSSATCILNIIMTVYIYNTCIYRVVPDRGGVYLILQGCVEKKAKDESTQGIVSTTVWHT